MPQIQYSEKYYDDIYEYRRAGNWARIVLPSFFRFHRAQLPARAEKRRHRWEHDTLAHLEVVLCGGCLSFPGRD